MDIVYEAFKKVPGITDTEAHEVASKLNRQDDLATKVDSAELEARLTWRLIIAMGVYTAIITFIIKFL